MTSDGITICYNGDAGSEFPLEAITAVIKGIAHGEDRIRGDITVILADDELLRQLNREWLGLDTTTDVLSFDLSDDSADRAEGEIYVSLDRVHSQAKERCDRPENELLRLIAHGMLHLCGRRHGDDVSLRRMIDRGEKYVQMVL